MIRIVVTIYRYDRPTACAIDVKQTYNSPYERFCTRTTALSDGGVT